MNERAVPATGYRWVICGLLFFATTINYIDRQILSLLKPILDQQLGWTSTEFGAINSAFQASYGVSLFLFGQFIDKRGTKLGYAVSIAAWSLAAIGHALVFSISGFFVARIALGMGEGGNFPAAIKATAQWFPKKERAFATSLFNSGANVGAIVAPAVVPSIAYTLGWHWAFIFAGIAGLIWIAFWWLLFEYPEQSTCVSASELAYIESDTSDPSEGGRSTWQEVLRHREAWSFVAAKFLTDPVWWFFLIWLPDFFKKTRGMDIKQSWTLLVSIYLIITILSVAGGWITGFLIRCGWSVTRARKSGMFTFALMVLPMAFVTRLGDWTAVGLIGLAGAAHQAWSANLYTTVSDMFPKRAVATLIGVGSTAGSLGGMVFPVITGLVLDKFVNGYTIIFGFCSVAYVVGFGINAWKRRWQVWDGGNRSGRSCQRAPLRKNPQHPVEHLPLTAPRTSASIAPGQCWHHDLIPFQLLVRSSDPSCGLIHGCAKREGTGGSTEFVPWAGQSTRREITNGRATASQSCGTDTASFRPWAMGFTASSICCEGSRCAGSIGSKNCPTIVDGISASIP